MGVNLTTRVSLLKSNPCQPKKGKKVLRCLVEDRMGQEDSMGAEALEVGTMEETEGDLVTTVVRTVEDEALEDSVADGVADLEVALEARAGLVETVEVLVVVAETVT